MTTNGHQEEYAHGVLGATITPPPDPETETRIKAISEALHTADNGAPLSSDAYDTIIRILDTMSPDHAVIPPYELAHNHLMDLQEPTKRHLALAALRDLVTPLRPVDYREPETDDPYSIREWLIPAWMPAGRLGLFSGAGGVGKSWLALQVAAVMAHGGGHFLGCQEKEGHLPHSPVITAPGGPVTYLTWEDDYDEVVHRLNVIRDGLVGVQTRRRMKLADLSERGPLWGVGYAPKQSHALDLTTALGYQIREDAQRTGTRLLIIDPLGAAFAGNENDRKEVRQFCTSWDGWGRRVGCAVLIIGHPPKTSGAAYSGSTEWHNAIRYRWNLEMLKTGVGSGNEAETAPGLTCEKMSYANDGQPFWLVRGEGGFWKLSRVAVPKTQDSRDYQETGFQGGLQ